MRRRLQGRPYLVILLLYWSLLFLRLDKRILLFHVIVSVVICLLAIERCCVWLLLALPPVWGLPHYVKIYKRGKS